MRAIKWGEIGIHRHCIGESFKVGTVAVMTYGESLEQQGQPNKWFSKSGDGMEIYCYEKYVRLCAELDVVSSKVIMDW